MGEQPIDYAALANQARTAAPLVDYAALADQARTAPLTGVVAPGSTFGEKIRNAASMLGSVLPAAGGIVGGIAGGVPGAAAGGAAGQGYKDLLEHGAEIPGAIADIAKNLTGSSSWALNAEGQRVPVDTGSAYAISKGADAGAASGVLDAGKEAAIMGAGEGVGGVLAKGAGKVATGLMGTASKAGKATLESFPDVTQTMIDNGLTHTKAGLAKVKMLLNATGKDEASALSDLDSSGKTIPIQWNPDLAEIYKTGVISKAIKSGKVAAQGLAIGEDAPLTIASNRLDPTTAAHLADIEQAGQSGSVVGLKPSQANILKDQAHSELNGAYKQARSLGGRKPIALDDQELMDLAQHLNNAIDTPGSAYRIANSTAQPLIGARQAIEQSLQGNTAGAIAKRLLVPGLGTIAGAGAGYREGGAAGALAGGAASAALTTPAALSHGALTLASPALADLLKALPKATADWLVNKLSGTSDQAK